MLSMLLTVGLFACGDDDKTDTGAVGEASAEPSGEDQGCGVTIEETNPADGASDFYYRGTLAFELSDDDDSASISLEGADGTAVDGTSSVDGDMVYFAPSAPLAAATSYVANLTYCGAEEPVSVGFSTSELGTVAEDVSVFVEKTYAVDLSSGKFVEPAGVGDLIGGLIDVNILVGVTASTETSMDLIGAISESASTDQDLCTETLSIPPADFSQNPYFEIDASAGIEISVSGVDVGLDSLFIAGTFAADGSKFDGAVVEAELDVRKLAPLLADLIQSEDPAEACNLLLGFGVTCEECSSDTEPYCIGLVVEDLAAPSTGTPLVAKTADDIAADTTCE